MEQVYVRSECVNLKKMNIYVLLPRRGISHHIENLYHHSWEGSSFAHGEINSLSLVKVYDRDKGPEKVQLQWRPTRKPSILKTNFMGIPSCYGACEAAHRLR